MRINKLSLENFRGFTKNENGEPIEINFPKENLCVLIGENGSGKTTILESLAISLTNILMLAPENKRPLIENNDSEILHKGNGFKFKSDDINNENDSVESAIYLELEHEGKLYALLQKANVPIIDGIKDERKFKVEIEPSTFYGLIDSLRYNLQQVKYTNLPILQHYDIGKIVIDNSTFRSDDFEEDKELEFDQYHAYVGALSKNLFDHKYFSFWFKDREDLENEFRLREQEDQREQNLEVIRLAIDRFIDVVSEGLLHNVRITRQKKALGIGTFSLMIHKKGLENELKLSQLSAGEKAILMLVADIGRRLSIANPGLYLDDINDRLPDYTNNVLQNATGIVIIDEIDLHLHPKWQRLVVPALTSTFPNVQFIITTHSPLVLNQIQDTSSILLINNQKVVSLKEYLSGYNTYGADIERIIKSVMEVESIYPSHVQELFNELNTLLDEDRIEDAKFKKQELEKLIDPFHPELLKAQTTIDYKEMMKE